jgi:uncharacterized protein RhaS with RHS repeats
MFTPGSRGCGYKTVSGRHEWLNRDPIQELGGLNLYDYVMNNPINKFDPDGQLLIGAIVGGVVGGISGAIGALAGGGDGWDALWAGVTGAALGAVTGLIDPTEGVLTLALVGEVSGIAGDAVGQGISMQRDPCKDFNWWELEGAGIGGLIGGGGGAILSDATVGIGEWGSNIIGNIFGAGPAALGGPVGAKLSEN